MKSGREKNKPDDRFRGRFEVKVDPKGRMSLPPGLRVSDQMVVTNHRLSGRNALHVYTFDQWERLENRVSRLSQLDASVQAFIRFYISGGQVVELDAQGRLLLPAGLRKFSGIEGDAVLVGLGDKLEVWSTPMWETLFHELTADFDRIQADVADLVRADRDSEDET
jgi:MraZ protein